MSRLLLLIFFIPYASLAGPFTDEMSKCLVRTTTDAEQIQLVKWIYAAISSHPDVQAFSNLSAEDADSLSGEAADIMMALLTERCSTETSQAIRYEGAIALQSSFGVLGQVAMQQLMMDPAVMAYFNSLEAHIDGSKLMEVLGE